MARPRYMSWLLQVNPEKLSIVLRNISEKLRGRVQAAYVFGSLFGFL